MDANEFNKAMDEREIHAYYKMKSRLLNSRICLDPANSHKVQDIAHLHASLLNVSRHISWVRMEY